MVPKQFLSIRCCNNSTCVVRHLHLFFFRTIIISFYVFLTLAAISFRLFFLSICRKLLFYSQADHFLNFVNIHTQAQTLHFHFLKFIFALRLLRLRFSLYFFFVPRTCNGKWAIYRREKKRVLTPATQNHRASWWWTTTAEREKKPNQITLDFVQFLWNRFSWNRCWFRLLFPLTSMICKSSQGK